MSVVFKGEMTSSAQKFETRVLLRRKQKVLLTSRRVVDFGFDLGLLCCEHILL